MKRLVIVSVTLAVFVGCGEEKVEMSNNALDDSFGLFKQVELSYVQERTPKPENKAICKSFSTLDINNQDWKACGDPVPKTKTGSCKGEFCNGVPKFWVTCEFDIQRNQIGFGDESVAAEDSRKVDDGICNTLMKDFIKDSK